jgi:hypothetical protein
MRLKSQLKLVVAVLSDGLLNNSLLVGDVVSYENFKINKFTRINEINTTQIINCRRNKMN